MSREPRPACRQRSWRIFRRKSTTATAERVPGSGESHSASAAAQAVEADRYTEMYVGIHRETARPEGAGVSRVRGETGHDSGLVPTPDRAAAERQGGCDYFLLLASNRNFD